MSKQKCLKTDANEWNERRAVVLQMPFLGILELF